MLTISSKDGKARFNYFEKDRIEIRISGCSGFLITVYKPGRRRKEWTANKAFASPIIQIGQSATMLWGMDELTKIHEYIYEAIDILNKEGYDLISKDFSTTDEEVNYIKVKDKPVKTIPTKHIVKNAVYQQKNGASYIFVHNGLYRIKGSNYPENWGRGDFVYLRVDTEKFNVINGNLVFSDSCCNLDAVSSPRRFIKKVKDIPEWNNILFDCSDGSFQEYILEDSLNQWR